jgi:predicted nucleic-acid-binding Zn-ribbon protein
MRNSQPCPKCQCTDIVRMPAGGAGNEIPAGPHLLSVVCFVRYLCASCGFMELWIDAAEDIAKCKKRYAS